MKGFALLQGAPPAPPTPPLPQGQGEEGLRNTRLPFLSLSLSPAGWKGVVERGKKNSYHVSAIRWGGGLFFLLPLFSAYYTTISPRNPRKHCGPGAAWPSSRP